MSERFTRPSTRLDVLAALALALAVALGLGCDGRSVPTAPEPEVCGPYPPAATSPYRLPIPIGESSLVIQGNCGGFSHAGADRYAIDFALEIGRPIVAARGGVVIDLAEGAVDGESPELDQANFVHIQHDDGTIAIYVHLQHQSVGVEVGDAVSAGGLIARSGLTGFSTGPHLHFAVHECIPCDSLPVTFSNASPAAPDGLQTGVVYTALPPGAAGD